MQRDRNDYQFTFDTAPKHNEANRYKDWKFTQEGKILQKALDKFSDDDPFRALMAMAYGHTSLPSENTRLRVSWRRCQHFLKVWNTRIYCSRIDIRDQRDF